MPKRRVVQLTDDQKSELNRWEVGPLTLRRRNGALIRPRADAGEADEEIVEGGGVSPGTVANVRRRSSGGEFEAAFDEQPRPGPKPTLDGKAEAIVIATAGSPVPEGRARWTARMLASSLVELDVVEDGSEDTILRVLKKAGSSRGRRSRDACPRA